MDMNQFVRIRKTVKAFDPNKKLSPEQISQIFDVLRFCPSSTNSQPWKFLVVESELVREKIATSTINEFASNHQKIFDASHIVILCRRTKFDADEVKRVLDQELKDGRIKNEQSYLNQLDFRKQYVEHHKKNNYFSAWATHQVYIALGFLLYGVSVMNIDACPMEGFYPEILDEALGLPAQNLHSVVMVALGYRSEKDYNYDLPKSRLDEKHVIELL